MNTYILSGKVQILQDTSGKTRFNGKNVITYFCVTTTTTTFVYDFKNIIRDGRKPVYVNVQLKHDITVLSYLDSFWPRMCVYSCVFKINKCIFFLCAHILLIHFVQKFKVNNR